ncbi:hypothetical protein QTP88_002330 [Uroleucon formosanum]
MIYGSYFFFQPPARQPASGDTFSQTIFSALERRRVSTTVKGSPRVVFSVISICPSDAISRDEETHYDGELCNRLLTVKFSSADDSVFTCSETSKFPTLHRVSI